MSRNRLVARRVTPAEAMDVWRDSDEASAFTRPDYLASLVDEVDWWGVDRSGEVVAAWPLVRAIAGAELGPPPFCYYVGPMFSRSLHRGKYHRQWSIHVDVFSALIAAVVSTHPRFSFSMPLGLNDLRVLQWWNFDHPGESGFTFTPRYTARVDLSELSADATECGTFASNRLQTLRRWMATPPTLVDSVTADQLIELHDAALERTGGQTTQMRQIMLHRMITLVQSGAGAVLGFRPAGQADIAAAILLLDGPEDCNAIFYGAVAAWRDESLIPWAVWQGLQRARDSGKRWFDFNGANSPGRAADKHFYGARPALHFDCSFGPS